MPDLEKQAEAENGLDSAVRKALVAGLSEDEIMDVIAESVREAEGEE
jgi:hypothetical protein